MVTHTVNLWSHPLRTGLLLSYGTIPAVERQIWCGTPACREAIKHLYGALGDARYSRDETDTGC